ncbi:MAG: hypothetical protein GXY33_00465 [Phycisphaerae bacterium]|nr:hypothetical protein [Phycisphaerae bacterium]
MYERLSADAQKAMKRAKGIADEMGQEYMGTEHILLALAVSKAGQTSDILQRHGATPSALRVKIEALIREQLSDSVVTGSLPTTPHLQKVMTHAIEHARRAKRKTVETSDLLTALIEARGSVARVALEEVGVDLEQLKEEIPE